MNRTAAVSLKLDLSLLRVSIDLPVAAERKISSPVADEALHILQRVAQKDADFMGKLLFQTQTARELPQQLIPSTLCLIAAAFQKIQNSWLCQQAKQFCFSIQIDEACTGLGANLQYSDRDAVRLQLSRPVNSRLDGFYPIVSLIAKQTRRLEPRQRRCTLLHQQLFKQSPHVRLLYHSKICID